MTWSPATKAPSGQPYRVVGYINPQNMVERVETWVEHPVMGDLHVDTAYSNYQDFGGLKVPGRIVQKQSRARVVRRDDHEGEREPDQHRAAADASATGRPGGAPERPGAAALAGGSARRRRRRRAVGEARRRRLSHHRRVRRARRRVQRSRRRARKRSERGARPGGPGGSEEGHSEQADPVSSSTRTRTSIMPAGSPRSRPKASRSSRTTTTRLSSRRRSAARGRWSATRSRRRTGNRRSRAWATSGCCRTTRGRSSCITSRTSRTPTAC